MPKLSKKKREKYKTQSNQESIRSISSRKGTVEVLSRSALERMIDEASFKNQWIDLENPTRQTLSVFWGYGLHLFTIEDCMNKSAGGVKYQGLTDYQIIVDREFFLSGERELSSHLVTMYVFEKLIITVHWKQLDSFEHVLKVVTNVPQGVLFADWVAVCMMDALCDRLKAIINEMVVFIDLLDRKVYEDLHGDTGSLLSEISFYSQSTKVISFYLQRKQEILNLAVEHKKISIVEDSGSLLDTPRISEFDVIPYIHIITDQINQMNREIVLNRSQLEVLSNTYMMRVSIELGKVSNEMNRSMKLFGVVTTVFLPASLVCGLWGMNVVVPGAGEENLAWFFGIIGTTMLYIVISLIIMYKFKFLN